jgi:eukaryotic-like serine/threonine-protein kinase
MQIMAEEQLTSASEIKPEATLPFDPHDLLDCLEASFPEPIAVVKLRGFIDEIGGEAMYSEPGLIRVRIKDPRTQEPPPLGLFARLGLIRKVLPEPRYLILELHLKRKTADATNVLEIAVVLQSKDDEDDDMRRGFGVRICRELKAYLMIR